jgi:hypothetical protein
MLRAETAYVIIAARLMLAQTHQFFAYTGCNLFLEQVKTR